MGNFGRTAAISPPTVKKKRTSQQYGKNVLIIDQIIETGFNASNESNITPLKKVIGKKNVPQADSSQNQESVWFLIK